MSRLHVVQGRSVGLRHARPDGPRPVVRGRWAGGVGVWPAVVGMRGLRSCGRAPAQSILHASWIQDVADRRIARSSPRSDMEASTVSYLRAALIERGAEARRGGVARNPRSALNELANELARRRSVGCCGESARGVARNPRSAWNEWCSGRAGGPSGQGARACFGHWNVDGARPISRENAAENAAGEEYPRRSETCVIEWELSRRRLTSTR